MFLGPTEGQQTNMIKQHQPSCLPFCRIPGTAHCSTAIPYVADIFTVRMESGGVTTTQARQVCILLHFQLPTVRGCQPASIAPWRCNQSVHRDRLCVLIRWLSSAALQIAILLRSVVGAGSSCARYASQNVMGQHSQ